MSEQNFSDSPKNEVLNPISIYNDEIDLKELLSAIWKGKWVIICITTLFAAASIFYAISVPDEYKSTVILSPVSSSGSSSLSKLSSQFGGLASFAGVNLGGAGGADKVTIAIELMQTWGFLESFISKNRLEVEVLAAKGWSKADKKLVIDESIYNITEANWKLDHPSIDKESTTPSSWSLYSEMKKRISISQDSNTGLVLLSVEHFSPHVAKKWADLLVDSINKHMQTQDRQEALDSISYLKNQIEKTSVEEMRSIFYQLIEEQTKRLMLADISKEYVFKTLSPAKVAEQKSKPKRLLIVVLGTVVGITLSVIALLIRLFIK